MARKKKLKIGMACVYGHHDLCGAVDCECCKQHSQKYCDYIGAVGGKCGMPCGIGIIPRCSKHAGKASKVLRQKGRKYSGPSEYRKAEGYKTLGFND